MILLWFIFGIFFIEFIFPILTLLVENITAYFEVSKGKYALDVTKINSEIQKLDAEEQAPQRVIGFTIPSDDYNLEEEEDEDE